MKEDFDTLPSGTVKYSNTERAQTTESNQTAQVNDVPFDVLEVSQSYEVGCKT